MNTCSKPKLESLKKKNARRDKILQTYFHFLEFNEFNDTQLNNIIYEYFE